MSDDKKIILREKLFKALLGEMIDEKYIGLEKEEVEDVAEGALKTFIRL